ncbi:glycyl-radical enzyme activating protein [Anaerococcus hydrogenalis]|uniref:Putative pyruvate formate-lyase 1-activating enzyme n=1 Tax=Anaerococcus hydrogenalis ACS-025-V-Sch4 TaxID=879306 RepID=F0H1G9_9FIRM|nr:glycyl-radical enzyme activating protein [Anaerococcus hydrogenalis]EGC83506.1 putative pyruvate formate-lyase 1-activating enzyme [Anaerococcus hydrogenalis ACS-025-V-Sch4]
MDSIDYKKQGVVFDIQRYSINDGPGIRTIVFLKGCPLRCAWCSNPESQHPNRELLYRKMLCIHCNLCLKACKQGALDPSNPNLIDREKCILCEDCANICPTGALEVKGKNMTVEEVINELKKDESYYHRSNGGITLSGGEALMQADFCRELLKACKARGWHTAIETEGYASKDAINKVMPYIDLALLDCKASNDEIHKKWTGVSNKLIRENSYLIQDITHTIIRIPTIPTVNSDINEYRDMIKFIKTLPKVKEIHILPYHNYGEKKYELLGRDYKLKNIGKVDEKHIEKLKQLVESEGFICEIGG